MAARLAIVLMLALGLGSARAGDGPGKKSEDLAGTWRATAIEEAGKKLPADQVQYAQFVLTGTRFSATFGPLILLEGTFTVDPNKSPETVDLKSTAGKHQGNTLEGIYKLEGDHLKLCFAEPGGKRPKEFSSSPANKTFLLTCRRKTTDWFAQWLYDKQPQAPPPAPPSIFVRSFTTPDDVEKVAEFYQEVVNRNTELKFEFGAGEDKVEIGGSVAFWVGPDGSTGKAGLTVGPQAAKILTQALKALYPGIDPVKIDTDVRRLSLAKDDSIVANGKDKARRPVTVRVFTHDTKEYTVTVVITRARGEQHTHIVATFVTR